jgi:GT2 family glycosyltransferase
MRCGVVVPSLGGSGLEACLEAVGRLEPGPDGVIVVISGERVSSTSVPAGIRTVVSSVRLGFAAAVNAGLAALPPGLQAAAVLNDDAVPEPAWLGRLAAHLERDPGVAAVQGTVLTDGGTRVDGRGIDFDPYGLPVQVDRGRRPSDPLTSRPLVAASATAVLLRREALAVAVLPDGAVFDEAFDSYHEDVDLGLRLLRLGWTAAWVPSARCRHVGSASGARLRWRHAWWVLANRWRALAGNLTPESLQELMPRLLRGELRAVWTLTRRNPRALLVAPVVLSSIRRIIQEGQSRVTPGPRLDGLPKAGGA